MLSVTSLNHCSHSRSSKEEIKIGRSSTAGLSTPELSSQVGKKRINSYFCTFCTLYTSPAMLQEINNEINGVKFITTATKNTSHNDEKLACAKYNKISKIWLFQRKEKKLLVKKGIRFSVEMATEAEIIAVLLIPCYTDSRFLWLSQIQNVSIQLWVLFRSKLESN